MLKFLTGLALLLLTLVIQFWLAFIGWHFTFALAVLIAFAFLFDFWELLILDLAAVFVLNWQPAPSAALIAFALIPLIAFAFRRTIYSELWIGNLVAVGIGFFLFYVIAVPALFIQMIPKFIEDVAIGLLLSEMVLVVMA